MVSVRILDIIKEENSGRNVIVLSDETGRTLLIFVAAAEALALAAGIRKSQFPRPMTFDMVCNLLKKAQVRISTVDISSLREGVFYSTIRFKSGETESEIDARPSDAMAIAVRLDVPIRVSEEVMTAAATEAGRLAQGMVALLKYIDEKVKQLASEKGWSAPDLLADPGEIQVTSLLSEQ